MKLLGALLVLVALAPIARAADGDMAVYGQKTGYGVQTICEHITDTGNETSCVAEVMEGMLSSCSVTFGQVQAACDPPTPIVIEHAQSCSQSTPNVWTTIDSLTGPAAVSAIYLESIGGRPMKCIRATFPASADPQCTDVEVVLGCTVQSPLR